jgi:hypothetical protein
MKVFSRVTNSRLITAALLVVIVGSLCFSVGEGLRLTPFPLLAQTQDASAATDISSATRSSLSQYGPLDVPTPTQKRGKRNVVELASGSRTETQPLFVSIVCSSEYEAEDLNRLALVAPPPGRAPPRQS